MSLDMETSVGEMLSNSEPRGMSMDARNAT
jgi:hypothetical protein